jgi:hypothetical protein
VSGIGAENPGFVPRSFGAYRLSAFRTVTLLFIAHRLVAPSYFTFTRRFCFAVYLAVQCDAVFVAMQQ